MYIFDEVVAVGFNTLHYDAKRSRGFRDAHLTPLNNNAILKTDSIVGFYLNIKMGRKFC